MNRRIVIGLAVSACLQMVLGLAAGALFPPSPAGAAPLTVALQAGAVALLASAAGAMAARQPFMRAALVLWAVGGVSSVLTVQRLAGGAFTVGEVAAAHAMAIAVSGIATVLGVRAGRLLDRRLYADGAGSAQ